MRYVNLLILIVLIIAVLIGYSFFPRYSFWVPSKAAYRIYKFDKISGDIYVLDVGKIANSTWVKFSHDNQTIPNNVVASNVVPNLFEKNTVKFLDEKPVNYGDIPMSDKERARQELERRGIPLEPVK